MDNGLLLAARSEYTEQLQDVLQESIYESMKKLWNVCKLEEKKTPLVCFQNKLCLIPEWNQEVINNHYKKILKTSQLSGEYLDKIIEAVFLSNIKILSVVKLKNKKQIININVPDTKNFIHRCFIESARQFYSDPHLVDDREFTSPVEISRNTKRSYRAIRESVEKTIRSMIPMEEILTKYLDSHEEEIIKSDSSSDNDLDYEDKTENIRENTPPVDVVNIPDVDVESIFEPRPDLFSSDPDTLQNQETGEAPPEPSETREPPVEPTETEPKLHINLNNSDTTAGDDNKEENFFSDSD